MTIVDHVGMRSCSSFHGFQRNETHRGGGCQDDEQREDGVAITTPHIPIIMSEGYSHQ